jgi:hypothetical protein
MRLKIPPSAGEGRCWYCAAYDSATHILEVQMSDHGLIEPRELRNGGENNPATIILPAFTSVDPRGETEVNLILPRTIVRPSLAKSTDKLLGIETVQIHEATSVKIDVAWGETPFYLDPRRPTKNREQLVEWSKGVATYNLERAPTTR